MEPNKKLQLEEPASPPVDEVIQVVEEEGKKNPSLIVIRPSDFNLDYEGD